MLQNIQDELVQKYLPFAIDIILKKPNRQISKLSQKQRVIITKIYSNINILCKMGKKQVVQFIKTAPSYQQVLSQLYFEQTLNNWRLITNDPQPVQNAVAIGKMFDNQCVGVEYRVQFSLASVGQVSKKKAVKAVILMVFFMEDGKQERLYLGLQQFEKFRYQVADALKAIYNIEMKTLL